MLTLLALSPAPDSLTAHLASRKSALASWSTAMLSALLPFLSCPSTIVQSIRHGTEWRSSGRLSFREETWVTLHARFSAQRAGRREFYILEVRLIQPTCLSDKPNDSQTGISKMPLRRLITARCIAQAEATSPRVHLYEQQQQHHLYMASG